MRTFSIILLLAITQYLFAQEASRRGPNLVENPGFERLRKALPEYDIDGSVAFRNSLDKWMSPSKSTPDLYMEVNSYGVEEPRSGKSMVGILTHNPVSKRSDIYREYIQTRLNKRLKEGTKYYLEFWVKRADKARLASNNIGAALLSAPVLNSDWEPLLNIEPMVNMKEVINPAKPEWVKVSMEFVANANLQFLIIGNFYDNDGTTFKELDDAGEDDFNNAYYYVDDVLLCELDFEPEPVEVEPPKEETLVDAKLEVGKVVRLNNIFFVTAQWDLLEESFAELSQLVALMHKYPEMKIAIHGHTDSRGGTRYNEVLSQNRARSVYDYLLNHGISTDRISSSGFGEARPMATNDTPEGRQLNRRVEFVVLELEGAKVEAIDNNPPASSAEGDW